MKVFSTRSDEQLSQILRIIVYCFKVIGLAPFSLQQIEKSAKNSGSNYCTSVFLRSKVGLAYNVLLLILGVTLSTLGIPQAFKLNYPNKTSVTQVVDVLLAIIRTSTACVIVGFWAVSQKNAASIMNRLVEVDALLSGIKNCPSGGKISFAILALKMIFGAFLWAAFLATEKDYISSFFDFFIFNVPMFTMHWFVVEYSIVVGLLVREFANLNNNLTDFNEYPNFSLHRQQSPNEFLAVLNGSTIYSELPALQLLHSIRTTLSDVSQDIAEFFSVPILPVVACFSLTLVYNFYYLITPLVVPNSYVSLSVNINLAAWIVACVWPLSALCYNVTQTQKKAHQTGLIVHKLLAKSRRQQIRTELQEFSLQLIHEDLSFTAYGFFPLDFTLIQSIFGATATYLVIIIQFMQSAGAAT